MKSMVSLELEWFDLGMTTRFILDFELSLKHTKETYFKFIHWLTVSFGIAIPTMC